MLEKSASLETDVHEYIAFLVSSALRLYEEPVYGSLRLLDAARRFINFVLAYGMVKDPTLVNELRTLVEKIDWGISNLWRDPERLREFLAELNVELAEKYLRLLE